MIRDDVKRLLHVRLHRPDRWEREVEDEIRLHLAMRAEQLIASGHTEADAHAEALRRFGPLDETRARLFAAARQRETRMQRSEFLGDLKQDLAFALRTLARQKAWTAVTIITLALGIGATTAVFSVVSTLMLHPLNYPHADRIVYVEVQPTDGGKSGISETMAPTIAIVRDWMKYSRGVEAFEGFSRSPKSLRTASGEPSYVNVESIFPDFPDFAGARLLLGRPFTQVDIDAGRNPVLVSEGFWRTRLNADPNVLGRTLVLHDSLSVIVGVTPSSLRVGGPASNPPDVWSALDMRGAHGGMAMMMRLRPGVTPDGLARELDSISARANDFAKLPYKAVVRTPAQRLRWRDSLLLLAAAVGLVLLVSCANVAHLFLARSATRRREMAIRAALGAGRTRLLRQLLTESLTVSLSGTAAGIFVGWSGLRALISLRPESLDALRAARLDGTTLALAITVAIISAAVFALIGGVQSARVPTHDALKGGAQRSGGARQGARGRGLLVISEMALSAMLLVGATLLVRSVMRLNTTDLGFDPRGLYETNVSLSGPRFPSDEARAQFLAEFAGRVRALPRVEAVTIANVAPGSRWLSMGRLQIEGERNPSAQQTAFVEETHASAGYFRAMGIPLRQGSTFSDTTPASHQLIVNEAFARTHWPLGQAIGRRVRLAQTDSEPWLTIVGVAGDVKTGGATQQASAVAFYTPMSARSGFPAVLIRTTGGAASLSAIGAIAKQLGVDRLGAPSQVSETIERSLAAPRFVMLLLSIFTVLALVLAAVGLYGVMAYTVAQETREIGIRVALGASGERIAGAVVGRAAALAGVGAVIGLAAALWATKVVETQLYGMERLDAPSFIIGAVVLIGAALLACIVPTRRALAVDPMTAIRAE